MNLKFDYNHLFRMLAKLVFFCIAGGVILFGILHVLNPDQGSVIDNTITYTTSSYTESIPLDIEPSQEDIMKSIPDYVTVPQGGVDWALLAQTKSVPYSDVNEKGEQYEGVEPEFSEAVRKLDGQVVIMQGYIFPLNAEEGQSVFLFGPFPVSCPYHYHVGPALVIEAHAQKKIKYQWDAVDLEGRLELVPRDEEYGVFYRLHDVMVR